MYDKNRLEAFNYLALSLVWENMACEGQKMYEIFSLGFNYGFSPIFFKINADHSFTQDVCTSNHMVSSANYGAS